MELKNNINLWLKNNSNIVGLPRPKYITPFKFYFKNQKRYLAKKIPIPYQSIPGYEHNPLFLNINNEKKVISEDLCPYCGIKIEDFDKSIRWMIEKNFFYINEDRSFVPSDFRPFHLNCMKEARIFCPFMRSLKNDQFDITIQKENINKSKNNIKKYFSIDWETREINNQKDIKWD